MKEKAVRFLKCMIAFMVILTGSLLPSKRVEAASISMSVSASTVYVGDPVDVTVNAYGLAGRLVLTGAVESEIWVDNAPYPLQTIYPSEPGSYYVSASGSLASFETESEREYSTGVTINVLPRYVEDDNDEEYEPPINNEEDSNRYEDTREEEDEEKSKDSTLKELSLSDGKLDPAFSSKVKEYDVDLDGDISTLKIHAVPNHKKASVKGDGKVDVHVGDNKIDITCIAEDGSKSVYTIHAHVDDKPLVYVNYKDKKLGVSRYSKELTKKLFEKTTIQVGGKDTTAWVNEGLNMTLLYLEDGKEKDFYFYDSKKEEATSIYRPMALAGENVAMIDVPNDLKKREGMIFTTVEVDGQKLPGWVYEDKAFANYVQIYVMNDAGEHVYYQYEKTKESMQIFDGKVALSQDEYNKLKQAHKKELQKYEMISYGCGIAVVALLGIIAFLFAKKRKAK